MQKIFCLLVLILLPLKIMAQDLPSTNGLQVQLFGQIESTKAGTTIRGVISSRDGNSLKILGNRLTFELTNTQVFAALSNEPIGLEMLTPGKLISLEGLKFPNKKAGQSIAVSRAFVLVDNEADVVAPLQALDVSAQTIKLLGQTIQVSGPVYMGGQPGLPNELSSLDKLKLGDSISVALKLVADQLVATIVRDSSADRVRLVNGVITQIQGKQVSILNGKFTLDLSSATVQPNLMPLPLISVGNAIFGFADAADDLADNTLMLYGAQIGFNNTAALNNVELKRVDSTNRTLEVANLPVSVDPNAVILFRGHPTDFSALKSKRRALIDLVNTPNGLTSNFIQIY